MPRLNAIYEKILPAEALDRWLRVTSFRRKSVVFTNGCFDILHSGHIQYLAKAASMGDFLFIGLNTDASVKKLKGPDRPYQDERTRAIVLAALGFVTAVALFDEETPYNLITKVQPDVLVKGGDYNMEDIVGYDIVKAKGGKVVTIPFVEGFSSTNIINKIRNT